MLGGEGVERAIVGKLADDRLENGTGLVGGSERQGAMAAWAGVLLDIPRRHIDGPQLGSTGSSSQNRRTDDVKDSYALCYP